MLVPAFPICGNDSTINRIQWRTTSRGDAAQPRRSLPFSSTTAVVYQTWRAGRVSTNGERPGCTPSSMSEARLLRPRRTGPRRPRPPPCLPWRARRENALMALTLLVELPSTTAELATISPGARRVGAGHVVSFGAGALSQLSCDLVGARGPLSGGGAGTGYRAPTVRPHFLDGAALRAGGPRLGAGWSLSHPST